jgi:hypothetical protein
MRLFVRYVLIVLNLALACAASARLVLGRVHADVAAFSLFSAALVFLSTIAFLKPYEKWVFSELCRWLYLPLGALFLFGLIAVAAIAYGASWATLQRFHAAVVLGIAIFSTAALLKLKRVKAFETA